MCAERTNELPLIVVGSGAAGLSAALAAAEAGASVLVLTAGPLLSGSSPKAQGGVAAAVGADDAPALHAADTLAVGAGLNDRHAVRVLTDEGRRVMRGLLARQAPFDGGPIEPHLGLEAGHSRRRILHAGGSATGFVLTSALLALAQAQPRIQLQSDTRIDELIVEAGRVCGVRGGTSAIRGRAVLLATGGYAGLWRRTTNPPENRGAGLSLAWCAGASLADLEFVQFHPTALDLPGRPAFLLSEALRGEGALVVDERGAPVCDPLLPRDVLARAIFRHRRERGPVFLSLKHLDGAAVRTRFPNIVAQLDAFGLDLARDLLPIAPAAHYCMGGVRTDAAGRTDVPGLYAAGEVACTGVQGANRLASNSLLECLVFGARAARAALTDEACRRAAWPKRALPEAPGGFADRGSESSLALGERLERGLGVERSSSGLQGLLTALPDPTTREVPPDLWLAGLIGRAALLRQESRGAHYRADAPESDDRWRGRIHWQRGSPGAAAFEEVSAP
ncbi:MAG: L-aspartate oxidase [Dehalococcoidia bacterium]